MKRHQNDAQQKYSKNLTLNTLNFFKMKYLNYLPVVMKSKNHLAEGFDFGENRIHLVVRMASPDAEYWTNTDCIVYEDWGKWKKGDQVFVKYIEIREAFGAYSEGKNTRIIDDGDTEVVMIKPDLVYLTIRDGEFIAQDGWCLVKQIPEEERSSLIHIPTAFEQKYKEAHWKVIAVGDPSPKEELRYGTDAIPQVGDVILSKTWAGIPLEAHLNKKLNDEYHLVRHNEILAYEV
jgi:co-chaperonin GroES (HSP10)